MSTNIESSKPTSKLPVLKDSIAAILDEMQMENISHLNLSAVSSFADDMFVASGRSSRHLHATADEIRQKLKNEFDMVVHIEGLEKAEWILIDAGDVIIHLFKPEVRELYKLESLWTAFKKTNP